MAARDCASVRIEPRIFCRYAELVAPRQDLHGERLVQLEEIDVVDRDSGLLEDAAGCGHRAVAHEMRLDACVGKPDEPELRGEAELRDRLFRGEERRGRAV